MQECLLRYFSTSIFKWLYRLNVAHDKICWILINYLADLHFSSVHFPTLCRLNVKSLVSKWMKVSFAEDVVFLVLGFSCLSPPSPFLFLSGRWCVWQGPWLASSLQQTRHTGYHSHNHPLHISLVLTPLLCQLIPSCSVALFHVGSWSSLLFCFVS